VWLQREMHTAFFLYLRHRLQEKCFNTRSAMELTFKLKLLIRLMSLRRYSREILIVF
jgi:hypothetical protein